MCNCLINSGLKSECEYDGQRSFNIDLIENIFGCKKEHGNSKQGFYTFLLLLITIPKLINVKKLNL